MNYYSTLQKQVYLILFNKNFVKMFPYLKFKVKFNPNFSQSEHFFQENIIPIEEGWFIWIFNIISIFDSLILGCKMIWNCLRKREEITIMFFTVFNKWWKTKAPLNWCLEFRWPPREVVSWLLVKWRFTNNLNNFSLNQDWWKMGLSPTWRQALWRYIYIYLGCDRLYFNPTFGCYKNDRYE